MSEPRNLAKPSGLQESTEAWRYRQIHDAVNQMGGWANFSVWVNFHAKEYFESAEVLRDQLNIALEALKKCELWAGYAQKKLIEETLAKIEGAK